MEADEIAQVVLAGAMLLGVSLIIIVARRWTYVLALAILYACCVVLGVWMNYDPKSFIGDGGLIAFVPEAVVALPVVIGMFVRFSVSLREMIVASVLIAVLFAFLIHPWKVRVIASDAVVEALRKRGQDINTLHRHCGILCTVEWTGPISDAEFEAIMTAWPVTGVSFHGTQLSASQADRIKRLIDWNRQLDRALTGDKLKGGRY